MKYISEIKPEPISGVETVDLFKIEPSSEIRCEFIRVKTSDTFEPIINIKVESNDRPTFKQTEVIGDIVVVGYGDKFGLYNFKTKHKMIDLTFEWYFGSFNIDGNDVFVATQSEIINVNLQGEIKWISEELGIDGVIIDKITDFEIEGTGECDPPGGWLPFKISRVNGKLLK